MFSRSSTWSRLSKCYCNYHPIECVVHSPQPYPQHRAAGTWWRSEGFPRSQPCSRRPPDAVCWGSSGQIPWWGRRSLAYCWLWSPLGGPPCAGTPWPVRQLPDRAPQPVGLGEGTQSQSGWQRARRGCLCLVWGMEMWELFVVFKHKWSAGALLKVWGINKKGCHSLVLDALLKLLILNF